MSRNYSMSVFIADHVPEKAAPIRAAAKEEWNLDDWTEVPRPGKQPQLLGWGDDALCAGELLPSQRAPRGLSRMRTRRSLRAILAPKSKRKAR